MSTENNLKTQNETDSFNLILSKQECLEKENKKNTKQVFHFNQWLLTYRSRTRVNFGKKLLNFSTVLACLPVAIGFLDFLRLQMSSTGQYESIFQKTLPLFANLQPKLTYETFHYVTSISQKQNLTSTISNNPKKLCLFGEEREGENLKLNSNKNNKGFFLGRPQFIATLNQTNWEKNFSNNIKKEQKNSPKTFYLNWFSGFSCSFDPLSSTRFDTSSKRNLFNATNSITQILDELPGYVQGLPRRHPKPAIYQSLVNSRKNQLLQINFFSSVESSKQSKNFLLIPSNFLLNSASQSRLRLLQNSQIYSLSTPFDLKKGFWPHHSYFSTNLNQLDKEFEKIFVKKQISLGLNDLLDYSESEIEKDFSFLKDFLKTASHIEDELIITKLLENLDNQTISKENEGFRIMSGYQYPDTTSQELSRFYKQRDIFQFIFGKREWLKNLFKATYYQKQGSSTKKYNFKIKNLPPFGVQTQETLLKSPETGDILYEGPSLLLDFENAFDWITRGNLRSWFHTYISPLNPFNQNSENFFGIYESPFSFKQKSIAAAFKDRSLFYPSFINNNINRFALVATPLQTQFLPFRSSFFVVPDSESNANNYVRGINTNLIETKKEKLSTQIEFLPIIQTKQPSFEKSSFKTTDFQGYSSLFDLGLTGKSDYIYFLDLVTERSSTIHYISGQYKKIPSIFSKASTELNPFPAQNNKGIKNKVFFDREGKESGKIKPTFLKFGAGEETKRGVTNWEPLTAKSWLVISQLSFALFSFQILKNLADNYGRELLRYLLDLVAALGFLDQFLKQEIELLMGGRNKGFRIIPQSSKTFNDIVGVQKFLPELYEVIWYLRNSARDFSLSGALPRGVLLTGPPGTGKTLLVQALAGEANVSLIILSGSSLIEPGELASTKLELVFQEARQIAPCIVFIDEIDTLAPKRTGVVEDPMAHDDIVDFLNSFEKFNPELTLERLEGEVQEAEAKSENHGNLSNQDNPQQLSLLTQILIELDGIRGRDGVLVIGATNRLDVLDSALLRPGRFDQIIEVGLPTKQKRIDILKFYGEKLGYQGNIPWNYLGERTVGFSAADLATLMNESALKAILNKKEILHTLQTIEHGIDRLTTSETEKPTTLKLEAKSVSSPNSVEGNISSDSKLSLLRFAYYQAGKVVVSSLLKEHPKSIFAALWPRCPNIRSLEITTNLQTTVFQFGRLSEINDRLIGCYAGKAAEFLFLEKFASYGSSQRSTLGLEDLRFGQTLAYCLLEKFLFYSKKSYNQQTIALSENINELEFPEMLEKLALYEELVDTMEYPPFEKALEEDTSSLTEKFTLYDDLEPQSNYFVPWWQQEASDALELTERNFHNWTHLYLVNPERSFRNVEWRPYDEFYHTDTSLKNVKTAFANVSKQKSEFLDLGSSIAQKQKPSLREETLLPLSQEKTRDQRVPQTTMSKEADFSKPSTEVQKIEIDNEAETEINIQNTISQSEEQVAKSKALQEKRETEFSISRAKMTWQDYDKTKTRYPIKNVYIPWNDVANLTRDYPIHSLILQSVNKALVILNKNRELVDRCVVDLLSQEILRQHEIEALLQEFKQTSSSDQGEDTYDLLEKSKEFEIVEASWGPDSRKPSPRWIDFAQFSK